MPCTCTVTCLKFDIRPDTAIAVLLTLLYLSKQFVLIIIFCFDLLDRVPKETCWLQHFRFLTVLFLFAQHIHTYMDVLHSFVSVTHSSCNAAVCHTWRPRGLLVQYLSISGSFCSQMAIRGIKYKLIKRLTLIYTCSSMSKRYFMLSMPVWRVRTEQYFWTYWRDIFSGDVEVLVVD